jgi:UDP-N-acetylglucosamine:LPS N-acetylglucosamine transferase
MFGDQEHNTANLVTKGTALRISFSDITYHSLAQAVLTLLNNNT